MSSGSKPLKHQKSSIVCGRYGFGNPARFHELRLGVEFPPMPARYNVAPTQDVPLVLQHRDGSREAVFARWGLVPFWAKDVSIGNRMINARGDTVRTKPAFKHAFKTRRGLMPLDLFYEWQALPGSRVKQPWCIRMPGDAPFMFGALWETWRPQPGADPLVSCSVITTEPNDLMRPIHDRMPVIIRPEDADEWLNASTPEDRAYELVAPYDGPMKAHTVSTYVNTPNNTDARCIESMTSETA